MFCSQGAEWIVGFILDLEPIIVNPLVFNNNFLDKGWNYCWHYFNMEDMKFLYPQFIMINI